MVIPVNLFCVAGLMNLFLIKVKGHCLVYDAFAPKWLANKSAPFIKDKIREHFAEIADRYKDQIDDWDIINEMLF